MTQAATGISCPSCGRNYKWKAEFAGKKAKCKCGGTVRFPAEDPLGAPKELDLLDDPHVGSRGMKPKKAPEAGGYDAGAPARAGRAAAKLVEPPVIAPPPIQAAPACKGCGSPLADGAVVCMGCGMNQKTGRKLGTSVQRDMTAATAQKSAGAGLGPWVPWLMMLGTWVVAGMVLGGGMMAQDPSAIAKGVAIGGVIIWAVGSIWGLGTAVGDNVGLRVACRFIPLLGMIMIIIKAINSWEEMRSAVITMLAGIGVAAMGFVMMVLNVAHGGIGADF